MKRDRQDIKSESGFTIVEILVAVVIVTLGLLAFGPFTGNVVNRNENSAKTTVAVNLAQEKLENLKNQVLNSGTLTNGATTENNLDERGVAGSGNYTRTTVITGGGANSLATATVTVSWTAEVAKSITLATKIKQS